MYAVLTTWVHCRDAEAVTSRLGSRELKKQANRAALSSAALHLALTVGLANLRVGDIAARAGVSPRTYNNYFPSRQHAIIAAITPQYDISIADAVTACPAGVGLAHAVTQAVIALYSSVGRQTRAVRVMLATNPALQASYLVAIAPDEISLAAAIARRAGSRGRLAAQVLAASIGVAVKVGLQEWLQTNGESTPGRDAVPSSESLAKLLRTALAALAPALNTAAMQPGD